MYQFQLLESSADEIQEEPRGRAGAVGGGGGVGVGLVLVGWVDGKLGESREERRGMNG